MAFSTSGQSNNIVAAIDAAHDQDARVVLVSGRDGGEAAKTLSKEDTEIRVPSSSTARIQEVHIMINNALLVVSLA